MSIIAVSGQGLRSHCSLIQRLNNMDGFNWDLPAVKSRSCGQTLFEGNLIRRGHTWSSEGKHNSMGNTALYNNGIKVWPLPGTDTTMKPLILLFQRHWSILKFMECPVVCSVSLEHWKVNNNTHWNTPPPLPLLEWTSSIALTSSYTDSTIE